MPVRSRALSVALLIFVALISDACRRKDVSTTPPVATAAVTLGRDKAPLGSPLDITYQFVVSPGATFTEDYRVMLHIVDTDEQLLWTDDHQPPTPTSQWRSGQTVEYTRTVFVPVLPYVGDTTLRTGLYSRSTQKRLTLAGEDTGQHAYKVGRLLLQPQAENIQVVFKDGWHSREVADRNASVSWQWTKKRATLLFKNPRQESVFYLDVDNPGGVFNEAQAVKVSVNGKVLDEFTVTPKQPALRKVRITAEQFGASETADIELAVDKTFVPAVIAAGSSGDSRELGVRVFHAFVAPVR